MIFDPYDGDADARRAGRQTAAEERERLIACRDALAGIADPAAQVERWKAMEVLARGSRERTCGDMLEALDDMLSPTIIAKIAAEWTPDE